MSKEELPQLTCQFEALPEGKNLNELTVGDPFRMKCKGLVTDRTQKTGRLSLAGSEVPYELMFLSLQNSWPSGLNLIVTSYVAGEHKNKEYKITDGKTTYATNPLNWTVQSVMNQQSPKELMPPMGPFTQSYPVWLWFGVGLFCLMLFALFFRKLRRRWQKRMLVGRAVDGDLSEISVTPYHEFNKTYRGLIRKLHQKPPEESLQNLDKAFKQFLLRRLLVPSFNWSHKEVVKEIKSSHRKVYENCGPQLHKLLREFQKLESKEVKEKDVEQMMNLSLSLVEKVDRLKQRGESDLR